MNQMTTRQRFHAVMNFQPFDRLPIVEWAPWWDKTIVRWREEGLSADLNGNQINQSLGMDLYIQTGQDAKSPSCPLPAGHGKGICWSMDDYERIREHLYPSPAVDQSHWETLTKQQESGDAVLWFTLEGFFWFPRELLGIEKHLYGFYDQPELMHRINSDLSEWMLRVIDEICSICTPDFMTFAEDVSYNHGPMISKELFDEFMRPCYEKIIPRLKANGIIPVVDSDGDIATVVGWFEEVGLEGILPLERQAGVDVAQLRRDHPQTRFIGAFDKMTMSQGEDAMRSEFERLLSTAAQGGFIISCDHQTPPGVSYQDYQLYLKLFREYAEKAARIAVK